jgi:DNA gyrase/topoisomerase IV subunit A
MKTILIITEQGRTVRARVNDFPIQMRGGRGIRGIRLEAGDKVASVVVIEGEEVKNAKGV